MAGGIGMANVAVSTVSVNAFVHISVTINTSLKKFNMRNTYKTNISTMFLVLFS